MMLAASLMALLTAAPRPAPCPYEKEIAAALADTARVWPVPRELVLAVIQRESACNPRAVSRVGAIGLMQVMPFNAERLGLRREDLHDPARNILAGTRLLAALLKHYRGDLVSTLVAYNARPRKLGAPIPENGETPAYVRAVLGFYRGYLEAAGARLRSPSAAASSAATASAERAPREDPNVLPIPGQVVRGVP